MTMLAPRPRSTAADLLRLLAVWLAAIVLVQGIAAAQALGFGPLHRHRDESVHSHRHHHVDAERHAHGAADLTVLRVGVDADAIDGTAFALTAALALMLLGLRARAEPDARRHVWRAAPAWAWRSVFPAGLLRPPRRG